MPEIKTVRIEHEDVPGGMVIEEKDFDPKVHKLFKAKASAPTPPPSGDDETSETKALRAKALEELPAADVKVIAKALRVDAKTKAAAIEAILAAEFPPAPAS